jgi:hypothetical protein
VELRRNGTVATLQQTRVSSEKQRRTSEAAKEESQSKRDGYHCDCIFEELSEKENRAGIRALKREPEGERKRVEKEKEQQKARKNSLNKEASRG